MNIKFTLSYIVFGMCFLGCNSQAESPPNNHLQTPVDSSNHGTVATPSSKALQPQSSSRQIPGPAHEPVVAKLPWRLLVPDKEFSVIPGTDTLRVSFYDLNLKQILDMQTIPVDAAKHFPNWLKLLEGKRIRISGYMFPSHKETNLSVFRLVPALQIMNFGAPIRDDEVIVVLLQKNKTTDYQQNRKFDVEGTFKIAPIVEEGELLGLYQLEEARLILH